MPSSWHWGLVAMRALIPAATTSRQVFRVGQRPLTAVRLGDVPSFLATLDGLAATSGANANAAQKSLLTFAR